MSSLRWPEDRCIKALKEADHRVDGFLSRDKYRSIDVGPTQKTLASRFGSWDEAKQAAGLPTFQREGARTPIPENRDWTEEEWNELSSAKRTRERNRSKLARIKVDRGCRECGYDESPVPLQFHHTDPDEKLSREHGSMSQLPTDQIEDEVEKCVVLCANCHQIEHHGDGRYDL